jgi:hypothetical protein
MSVPVVLAALAVILAALSLGGDGMCREERQDERQTEQTASE